MFLITNSETTHKVTLTSKPLGSMLFFMESCVPNPDFDQNHVLALREQLHRFRGKPSWIRIVRGRKNSTPRPSAAPKTELEKILNILNP